ncbi:MAG: asparagine synthase (glutamine-hydrolyzing) [Alphaproteobacteria bacterium]|nr:asparagine synthase (glutamine-hydrolyzing) [Alphaproteobacteria bacterium]
MCGIAGLIDPSRRGGDLTAAVRAMTGTLVHRGPDGDGLWTDKAGSIGLGHRRLAIVDLSAAGHQPMVSSDGRWVITYNGEIYNAVELRSELEGEGACFRGHSDTEVLIEACARWGVEATLPRLVGMFAFGLWDTRDRCLYLVRDRLGIKPLYWAEFGDLFLFGSELKALRAHTGWTPEADRDSLAAYMRHNYVPGPATIYQRVQKLEPGYMLVRRAGEACKTQPYWRLEDVAREGQANRIAFGALEAIDELERVLGDAVRGRMIADVPLGAFLSGGIDSSLVVALMQANSARPVRTFSIGFHEQGYDEAGHAREVAAHLGTDHTELYVEARHAMDTIPRLAEMFDEPFADSSQIPTLLVSEMTRKHVTVALSGDGGDELFAGYTRYFQAAGLLPVIGRLPGALRRTVAAGIQFLPPAGWSALFGLVPGRWRPPQPGDKMHKLAGVLSGSVESYYRTLVSHWPEPDRLVLGGTERRGLLWDQSAELLVPDAIERMQYLDTKTYLPDDILTKVDRTSMAISLEARVPLLDHRVADFAWSLPPDFKVRNGGGKWLLRQLLLKYVPSHMVDRPKMGFGVPIDAWLRGPLRDWAEELLSVDRLRDDGYFDPAQVRQKWAEHLGGGRNWQYLIWDVLMFQLWKDRWL